MAKNREVLHRKNVEVPKNFMAFLRSLVIALTIHVRIICICCCPVQIFAIIIHQTHYEKSDWSRAFNQFTIACELDMINAISAADIAFIMSKFNVCLVT